MADLWYRCNACNNAWLEGMSHCKKCDSWDVHLFFAGCDDCVHADEDGDCRTQFDQECVHDPERVMDQDYFEPRT